MSSQTNKHHKLWSDLDYCFLQQSFCRKVDSFRSSKTTQNWICLQITVGVVLQVKLIRFFVVDFVERSREPFRVGDILVICGNFLVHSFSGETALFLRA